MNLAFWSATFAKGRTVEDVTRALRAAHRPGALLASDVRLYFEGEPAIALSKEQPLTALIGELCCLPKLAKLSQNAAIGFRVEHTQEKQ